MAVKAIHSNEVDRKPVASARCVAVYLRVPLKEGMAASQESSLRKWQGLRDWARSSGCRIRWFRDTFSPTAPHWPGWESLRVEIEAGRVAAVACWRLDRLGMTCTDFVAFLEKLLALDVNLMSQADNFNLLTPAGRQTAGVLASLAAYEAEVRAERILAGQAAARARGVRWGGSVKGRRLKVTPEVEAAVRRLHSRGTKIAQIARETGLSRPTVYSVLAHPRPQRPKRTGKTVGRKNDPSAPKSP